MPTRRSGRTSSNAEPTPGWPDAEIMPPMAFASAWLMDSPSPVPPKRRVIEPSACSNLRNSLSAVDPSKPIPVSVTRIKTDVETSLPSKKEILLYAQMTPLQKKLDKQLREKTLQVRKKKKEEEEERERGHARALF